MGPEDTQQAPTAATPPPAPAATPTPAPAPQTQQPNVTATIPEDQQHAQAPTVLIPQKKTGLAGIVQEFRDAVAGTTTPETYIDPNTGEKYVQHPYATPGQQWMRIAGEAVQGAAAGLAHGQGPGGGERAAAAGIEAGVNFRNQQFEKQDQEAEQNYQQQRQAKIDRANDQINTAKLVAQQLANTRMQVKGSQADIDWAETQQKFFEDPHNGFRLVGTAQNVSDLSRIQREDEQDLLKNHYQQNSYVTVPMYNADGTAAGISIYAKSPGWGQQLAPSGTSIPIFTAPAKPGEAPTRKDVTPTVPMTNDQVQSYNTLFNQQMTAWQKQQKENELTDAKTTQAKTAAQANTARAGEASANARKADAQTKQTKVNMDEQPLVDMIGTGKMAPERLSYILGRDPQLLASVAKDYPGTDTSKLEAYPKVYAEFTSGKKGSVGYQLNAGAAAFKHLAELKELNTAMSHVPHSPAWTAYMNKADTVSTELANFYGDATIPGIEHIKSTLTSTLPGNRDRAITTQAQSMSDKVDNFAQQWRNAAPSKFYEAPMPGMDDAAKAARAKLDPRFAVRYAAEQHPGEAGSPASRTGGSPQPQKFSAVSSDGKWGWNGSAWVPNTGGQQ